MNLFWMKQRVVGESELNHQMRKLKGCNTQFLDLKAAAQAEAEALTETLGGKGWASFAEHLGREGRGC